jgi:hypothetical protein
MYSEVVLNQKNRNNSSIIEEQNSELFSKGSSYTQNRT